MKLLIKLLLVACIALNLSACSNSEKAVDLKLPTYIDEPKNGPKVMIADVTDNRMFIGNAKQPNLPSGKILSKDYKSRAYARLKNMFNEQSGALLLPKNSTVADLFKKLISRAFSEAGYQVVEPGFADDEETIVVAVSIKQFWTWAGLDNMTDDINSDIELDIYTQQNNMQKHFKLKNRQTRKVITDTKTLYKTTTEQSLENIYHLAIEKIQHQL